MNVCSLNCSVKALESKTDSAPLFLSIQPAHVDLQAPWKVMTVNEVAIMNI